MVRTASKLLREPSIKTDLHPKECSWWMKGTLLSPKLLAATCEIFLFFGDSCVHLCMCARSWCVTMPSTRAQVPTRSGISRRDTVKDETTKAKKTNESE